MKVEFKVGDEVECIHSGNNRHIEVGGKYVVKEVCLKGDISLVHNDFKHFYAKGYFKLAESNPMPTLEAGMVVEYKCGYRCVYINDKLGYSLGESTHTHFAFGYNLTTIVKIYQEVHEAFTNIDGSLSNPIWSKTPPKTKQQIKDEKIQAEIDKMKENITNLEKELHDGSN